MSKENKRYIVFFGSEPVLYDIKDKETGKTERVISCRVVYGIYDDEGCRGVEICKATPDFADYASKHVGETIRKQIACDTRGRACCLYES